jgi:hypothetical protein
MEFMLSDRAKSSCNRLKTSIIDKFALKKRSVKQKYSSYKCLEMNRSQVNINPLAPFSCRNNLGIQLYLLPDSHSPLQIK